MTDHVAPRPDGPPVLVIANQKGGVGKTATALEIAAAAAQNGHRALLIDMDPQANATRSLGLEPEECAITTGDLLSRQPPGLPLTLAEAIHRTEWPGVDAVPSNLDLAKREADNDLDVPYRLRKALLRSPDILDRYTAVVIDCPPSLGRLLAAALTAGTHAVLVTEPAADAIRGVANVIDTIDVVQENLNAALRIAGIIINKYKRTNERDFREAEIRERYGDLVIPGHTTERDAMSTAHAAGVSVYSLNDEGSKVLAARFTDLYQQITTRITADRAAAAVSA